jgi:hypothetical protein
MNEQLQQSLADILVKVTSGVEAGVSFLSAELPDVVYQLLTWKILEAGLAAVFSTLLLVTILVVLIKYSGVGREAGSGRRHKITLTHDEDGDIGPHVMFTYGAAAGAILFSTVQAYINLMLCLKIYIAPKIYLIEYASSLVK